MADQTPRRTRQKPFTGASPGARRYCPALRLCRPKPLHAGFFQKRGLQSGTVAPPSSLLASARDFAHATHAARYFFFQERNDDGDSLLRLFFHDPVARIADD